VDEETKRDLMRRYKATSSIYNKRYSQIQSHKYQYIDSLISLKEFSLILDLGGGTGLLRAFLPPHTNLIIIDYSLEMIQQASSLINKNSNVVLADVEYLPIRKASLPLIVGFSIMQNLPNPVSFLRNLLTSFPTSNVVLSGIKKSPKLRNFMRNFSQSTLSQHSPTGIEDVFYIRQAKETTTQ
jgi:SAM-dependent methyltransferase